MKKITIIAAICLMFAASLQAHSITPIQLKQARMAVYQWIRDYNVYVRMEGKREPEKKFISLFEDESTLIFNDYLPLISTYGPKISVKAYASILANRAQIYKMSYEITNATITSEYVDENGNIVFSIEFDKIISFNERGNFSDDRYAYPQKSYHAIVHILYDMREERALARDIYSDEKYDEILVLHDTSAEKANQYVTLNEIKTFCDDKESGLVKWRYTVTEFDNQMICLARDTNKNNVHVGGSFGYSSYSGNLINENFFGYAIQSKLNWNLSAGYYHQLLLKDKNRFGMNFSLVFTQKNVGFKADAYNESYKATDPDGGNYLRLIDASTYQETIKRYAIEIPIDFRYDYFIKDNLSIYTKIGAYVSYDIIQKANATAHVQYSGYYDWLFNVTLSQNGIYDFGTYNISGNSNYTGIGHFGLGVFAGIGIQYFIPKSKWSIEGTFMYEFDVYNKINNIIDFHLTENNMDWKSASYLFESMHGHNLLFNVNINYNF